MRSGAGDPDRLARRAPLPSTSAVARHWRWPSTASSASTAAAWSAPRRAAEHLLLHFERPRPPQPPGDERRLAPLPARRRLAPAALPRPGRCSAASEQEAVQFGGPTLRLLRADRLPPRPAAGPPRPRHARRRARPRRRRRGAARRPRARRSATPCSTRPLVAGIGNIFKSEACFAARVDPWRPLGDLTDEELRAVLAAAREQMLAAVASGRHTSPSTAAAAPARRCGGRIASRGQGDANRTTYWCPRCQVWRLARGAAATRAPRPSPAAPRPTTPSPGSRSTGRWSGCGACRLRRRPAGRRGGRSSRCAAPAAAPTASASPSRRVPPLGHRLPRHPPRRRPGDPAPRADPPPRRPRRRSPRLARAAPSSATLARAMAGGLRGRRLPPAQQPARRLRRGDRGAPGGAAGGGEPGGRDGAEGGDGEPALARVPSPRRARPRRGRRSSRRAAATRRSARRAPRRSRGRRLSPCSPLRRISSAPGPIASSASTASSMSRPMK